MLKETLKRNEGITLLALAVMVIALSIIAGISINELKGNNGIIKNTLTAKEKTDQIQEDENALLEKKYPSGSTEENVDKLPTGNGTIPYLPNNDFSYKEGDLDKGLVIKDKEGNEYVWVEVPFTIYNNATYNSNGANKPSSSADWENIEKCLKAYTSDYSDSSYNDRNTNFLEIYKKMLRSVYRNGGFWVGRYEAGYELGKDEAPRNFGADTGTEQPTTQQMVIKKNAYPYTWVRYSQAQELATGMNYENCTSSLMFGIQWDLVLKFFETKNKATKSELTSDSTERGNYINNKWNITNANAKYSKDYGKSFTDCPYPKQSTSEFALLTTGADESFSVMNIYDIAGNVWELTLEFASNSSPCVFRGGSFGTSGTCCAKYRFCDTIDDYLSGVGFRVGLWRDNI